MIKVGVIGCGYWGPNLIRNFSKLPECTLSAIADFDTQKREAMARLYPGARTCGGAEEILEDGAIDAVVIATPISTHFALASSALKQGKHVFVEKPISTTVDEARELADLSARNNRTLMADHTFIYCGAVRKMKELITSGQMGDVLYYDSVRVNLGLFQHDVNVLWDLAPHDFSIMTYLIEKRPVSVSAIGACPVRLNGWRKESLAYVTVRFEDETTAHFHVNWLSPVKVRQTLIGCSRKMIKYDHLDPDNQVKVFDKGLEFSQQTERCTTLVQYRTGDMLAPKIDQTEALEVACRHFLDCIRRGVAPVTDAEAGLKVVALLEAAQRSLVDGGTAVAL